MCVLLYYAVVKTALNAYTGARLFVSRRVYTRVVLAVDYKCLFRETRSNKIK